MTSVLTNTFPTDLSSLSISRISSPNLTDCQQQQHYLSGSGFSITPTTPWSPVEDIDDLYYQFQLREHGMKLNKVFPRKRRSRQCSSSVIVECSRMESLQPQLLSNYLNNQRLIQQENNGMNRYPENDNNVLRDCHQVDSYISSDKTFRRMCYIVDGQLLYPNTSAQSSASSAISPVPLPNMNYGYSFVDDSGIRPIQQMGRLQFYKTEPKNSFYMNNLVSNIGPAAQEITKPSNSPKEQEKKKKFVSFLKKLFIISK
jgi:hypothetical protein